MLRRIRRPAALLAPLLLLSAVATACGSDETIESGSLEGEAAYTLSGDVGTTPEVAWKGKLKAGEAKTDVVTVGDGAALAADDEVLVNYYVGNGYTEKTALDTYSKDLFPLDLTVGAEVPAPTSASPTADEIAQYLLQSLIAGEIKAGDTIGTRKTITVNAANVVGANGSGYDIGNEDGLLVVVDINSAVLPGPDGEQQPRSPGLPSIVVAKKLPASLDFAKTPEPDGKLHTSTLIKGTGAVVKTDDQITVNYLGQVYDATVPFDLSYTADRGPTAFPIGQGAVIKGWDQALVGVTVGSRVILEIPSSLGYGKDGQPNTDEPDKAIPGGATLFFLIDVLAAG